MASQMISLLTNRSSLINAVAGSAGAMASIACVYPLIVLRTKAAVAAKETSQRLFEVPPTRKSGSVSVAELLTNVLSLYNGIAVSLVEGGLQKFVYFYSFAILSKLQAVVTRRAKMSTLVTLIVGYLAALSTILFSLPLESISTKLQLDSECSIVDAVTRTITDLPALLRGVVPSVFLCINPAIQFTVYERLKAVLVRALLRRRARTGHSATELMAASLASEGRSQMVQLSTAQSFWLGACSKAVATLLTFPLLTAKLMLLRGATAPATNNNAKNHPQQAPHLASESDDVLCEITAPAAPNANTPPLPANSPPKRSLSGRTRDQRAFGLKQSHAGSAVEILLRRFHEEGASSFYKGIVPQLVKGMIGSAIMMSIKEKSYAAVFSLLSKK
eukprot:INCI11668.1.p1 GENE.INCI11668.1~~INCI11668.1.p1  ORF type:complete len:389 (+),score=62.05 INCI11668.1:215-1381(+)